MRGSKLANLLDQARSAVTINSTAAQQVLWRGLPLKIFGNAIYDKLEFVSQADLAEFFARPTLPNARGYRDFRKFLLETSQVAGGYYSRKVRQQLLRRFAGDGSTILIIGAVGGQGIYVIERPTRTLGAMLAKAGGVTIESEVAQITVFRNKQREKVWFQDLYDHPDIDVALRGGDRILVETDTRAFTSLGATAKQGRISFPTQTISAIEALALVGGLNANSADPKGIFVFRNEDENIANQVLGRKDLKGAQRLVYVLDLTKPNRMFAARDFVIRDQDTVYVTEAPFAQWNKVIAATTGSLGAADTINTSAQSLLGQ